MDPAERWTAYRRDEEAVARFVERFAMHLADVGFSRMPARVFAALITADDGRLPAAELAELLKASPGAVSVALRYLTRLGLVTREREPGERRDRYRVYDDMWYEVFTHRDATLARWEECLREGLEAVGADSPAGVRLRDTLGFFAFLRGELTRLIAEWRDARGDLVKPDSGLNTTIAPYNHPDGCAQQLPDRRDRGRPDTAGRADDRDREAVSRFVERFALHLSEAGFPRMPARVFVTILVADEGQRTAAELGEVLRISPAAVSGAVRYLSQVGLVARERLPGERRDRYRIYDDTWYEALTRQDSLYVRWEQDLREGMKAVNPDSPAGARLDETRRFFGFLREEFSRVMGTWRERRSSQGVWRDHRSSQGTPADDGTSGG